MSKQEQYTSLSDPQTPFDISAYKEFNTEFYNNKIIFGTNPNNQELVIKFPSVLGHAQHELLGYESARKAGILVPKTYGLIKDSRGNIGLVTEKVIGKNLFDQNVHGAKHKLGSIVRSLHDLVIINENDNNLQTFEIYDSNISTWKNSPMTSFLESMLIFDIISQFSFATADMLEHDRQTFTHQDLHDAQIIVDYKADINIIDFEEWRKSNPMEDIAIYLYHGLRTKRPDEDFKNFTDGYLRLDRFTDSEKKVISFYLLYFSLKMEMIYFNTHQKFLAYATHSLNRSVSYVNQEKLWKM